MRSFLYPVIGCLVSISVAAQSAGTNGTSNLCDPPIVLSTHICDGGTATRGIQNFDPSSTYNWYADPGHILLLATGSLFTTPVLHATTQFYIVATNGTCSSESTFTVSVDVLIPPIVKSDTICDINIHDGHIFILNPQPGYIYNWYRLPSGNLVGTGTSYTMPFSIPSYNYNSFYVEATYANCTSERIPASVIYVVLLDPPVIHDTTICQGGNVTLTVENINSGYQYYWYNSPDGEDILHQGNNYVVQPPGSATYYLKAKYKDCSSVRMPIIVNVNTVSPPDIKNAGVCPGNSAQLAIQNPHAGYLYSWYADPSGTNLLATATIFTTPALHVTTTYYVDVFDGKCSSLRVPAVVNIFAADSPRVTVTNITGSSLSFSWPAVPGAVGYQVSVNAGPYISPSSGAMGTTHTVSGLAQEQTVNITVVALSPPGCADGYPGHATGTTYGLGFYVPSAFTPNSDHLNDIIKPKLPGGSVLDYFTVYNRWGQRIFSTTTIGKGWDGKFQGIDQSPGTYVWICRYHFASGQPVNEKGAFTLLY